MSVFYYLLVEMPEGRCPKFGYHCYGWLREFGQIIGRDQSRTYPLCGGKLINIGIIAAPDIEAMARNAKLRNVPLSQEDIYFLKGYGG